ASEPVRTLLDRLQTVDQRGFYTHKILEEIGVSRAYAALAILRDGLGDELDPGRGELLFQALLRELERTEGKVKERVLGRLEELAAEVEGGAMSLPFASLTDEGIEEVRRAVRLLAERLMGAARVKHRRKKRGPIDPGRTMRQSLVTGGLPFRPVRRNQVRDKPRLMVLCDVSDSVRPASRFMLEFVYAVSELFERTRSFVFVSEMSEATRLFDEESVPVAVAKAKALVDARDNSSYGRVFRQFEERYLSAVDRRTTVVILGDGRTNYQPDGADSLARIEERAKCVLWLCPEPRASWGSGDSAMPRYVEKVTQVLEVASANDLEAAARELLKRR
ncbi:MAG TPA: VWA domain-containing protein, partial [Polyangiaceae bacterium]|nr:VWA domain-containing protein [Polyangiaceae bacterium]